MAIVSMDNYIASVKQDVVYTKTASRAAVANTGWWTVRDLAGNPGATAALTTAGAATTGSVPTDAVAGFPIINAFGGAATGYLTGAEFTCSVASRMALDDILWWSAGVSLLTAATTTFSTQPSYSSRVPGGTDYTGLKLFVEIASITTAGTAGPTVTVTYTNQAGTAARTTGAVALGIMATAWVGRWIELPLQSGDSGIQKVESITVNTVATGNTVLTGNVIVARPLWSARVSVANGGDSHDPFKCGFPICYADMAVAMRVYPDGASTGSPDVTFQIANN